MGIFTNWLTDGYSMNRRATFKGRLALWFGRRLALRHRGVTAARSAMLSCEAKINPRNGRIVIGENVTIGPGALIQGNVRIGRDSSIQSYTMVTGYGKPDETCGLVSIGCGVRIAGQCVMVAGNHNFADPDIPIHNQGLTLKPITIEDDVWIGANTNIMAGVTVGRGSVIGGGAVVTRDIPPYSIAVGSPARVIKSRKPVQN